MPHVRHVCVLLPLVMPFVRHIYLGSTKSEFWHRDLTHQWLYSLWKSFGFKIGYLRWHLSLNEWFSILQGTSLWLWLSKTQAKTIKLAIYLSVLAASQTSANLSSYMQNYTSLCIPKTSSDYLLWVSSTSLALPYLVDRSLAISKKPSTSWK